MSEPLYALSQQYRALLEAGEVIDHETGEVMPVDGALRLLEGDISSKATGLLGVCAEWSATIAALKAEEERMAARRRILEGKRERVRAYVAENMDAAGIKSLSAGPWKLSLLPPRESVVCEDPERVPPEFQRVKTEPDIAGAKAMLKETGMLPPGFIVKPGKPSLRVQ